MSHYSSPSTSSTYGSTPTVYPTYSSPTGADSSSFLGVPPPVYTETTPPYESTPSPLSGGTYDMYGGAYDMYGDSTFPNKEYGTSPPSKHPPPPPTYTPSSGSSEKFPEHPKFRDLPFATLFGVHLVTIAIIFVSGMIYSFSSDSENEIIEAYENDSSLAYFVGATFFAIAIGLVCAVFWMLLARLFARILIILTIFVAVGMLLLVAAIFFISGLWFLGIIFSVLALLWGFLYFVWRKRIPFATAMLTSCIDVLVQFPATIRFGYGALAVHMGWVFVWALTLYFATSFIAGAAYPVIVYLLFSFYWTSQVIKNTLHVTVSGTVATWYFTHGTTGVPPNPTIASFKRATTTSFGSICFGSLIVAVLETIKTLCYMFRRSSARNGHWILAILALMAECFIGFIDALLRYFNLYAFTQVAIYGKSYIEAAKATWKLIFTHGYEAIINDNLIDNVLMTGSLVGGVITAILSGILGWILYSDPGFWFIGFFVGYTMVMIMMGVIQSAVSTMFVCFAEEPLALQRNNPELFELFRSTYGHCCAFFGHTV